jgi:hypothetical protein
VFSPCLVGPGSDKHPLSSSSRTRFEGSGTASVAEAATEFGGGSAVDEVVVRVLSGGEIDHPHLQPGPLQPGRYRASCILSGRVSIEGDKDRAVRPVGQLRELPLGQVDTEGAAGIDESCLPKDRQVQQTFYQNHLGMLAGRTPGEGGAALPTLRPYRLMGRLPSQQGKTRRR